MLRLRTLLPAGSVVLGVTTIGSYVAGFLRDRVLAQTFGASRTLDAYNASFLLPDFIFHVAVASGVAAAVVPIFSELFRRDRERASAYANTVLLAATGTMTLTALVLFLVAGPASRLVTPGFSPEDRALVADLMRILAFSPLLFAASNTLGALLVARRRFLFYGLSPIFYNVGIIAGVWFLTPHLGIRGVAVGTLIGAALHLIARIWDLRRFGLRFAASPSFRLPEFRQTLLLMLPKMFGHPVELATFWGFTMLASALAPGTIAILNIARNLQSVPVSVLGITMATTTFPLLAHAATDRAWADFRQSFFRSFWLILAASGSAALLLFLLRAPLVATLFGGQAFTAADVARTAATLGIFTLAIPTEALAHLAARAFYATKNTVVPVSLSVLALGLALGAAVLLRPTLGLLAFPLAFALASSTRVVLLLILLSVRLRRLPQQGVV